MIAALFPEDCSETLSDALAVAGVEVTPLPDLDVANQVLGDVDLVVVELGVAAVRQLREVVRVEEAVGVPVLLVLKPESLALLEGSGTKAEFLTEPIDPVELRIRAGRLVHAEEADEMLSFKDLSLNPLTYQATLAGAPMDLTFMEYELLRFLVANPLRVWSREQLLSKVWGYEYYGGARTVDVHIRRLRSKLGEGRSSWITTVRSVGYRFG